jgi:hypothetical protein
MARRAPGDTRWCRLQVESGNKSGNHCRILFGPPRPESGKTSGNRCRLFGAAESAQSAPITGLTADPERTLNELFGRYVVAGASTPFC